MTAEAQRQIYFKRFAANAVIYGLQSSPEKFICPICYKRFNADDCLTVNGRSVLTLAHVYPEELGCAMATLACGGCNTALNRYDRYLILDHHISDNIASHKPFSVAGRCDDGYTFRAIASFDGTGFKLEIPQANNPKVIDAIKDNLGFQAHIDTGAREQYVHLGLLHAAHLLMFREFGYEYLFCWLGHWVRRRIMDCAIEKLLFPPVINFYGADGFPSDKICKVLIVREPREHRCIYAVLPAPKGTDIVARAVVLPVSSELESINALLRPQQPGLVISFDTEPPHKRLANPQWKNHLWKSLQFNAQGNQEVG